jgi:hypothetical protein
MDWEAEGLLAGCADDELVASALKTYRARPLAVSGD